MKPHDLPGTAPSYVRLLGRPTPLAVYRRLYARESYGFLYESLEEHGTRGRYSFVGGRPRVIFRSTGKQIEVRDGKQTERFEGRPLEVLRELVRSGQGALPVSTFPGGAVGYLGYDIVRSLAPIPSRLQDDLGFPDAYFVFPEEVLVFDHLDEVVHVLTYGESRGRRRADEIAEVIAACEETIATPPPAATTIAPAEPPLRSNISREQFEAAVLRAKEYIRCGDLLQVVLSQRFEFEMRRPALELYSALRHSNPSPYMYYLDLDGMQVTGSSPEVLVKLNGRRVVTRPLAGTRPRGATPEEDRALAEELLKDEKERAEHVMLVDLARNDIGRDCERGSVRVDEFMNVERYSNVMHLVSNVVGRLRDDRDAFDLISAAFPAGTVSGAPKVRAMQIIEELEPVRRGPYAGAIGYFSYLGDMDLCIAIRTIVSSEGSGFLQAGAGIVADSEPDREYRETLAKARGLLQAIRRAENGHHEDLECSPLGLAPE